MQRRDLDPVRPQHAQDRIDLVCDKYEIAGDGGLLTHDSRNNATLFISTAEKQEAMSPLADADEPYNKQIAAFAKSIVEGTPLAVTGADGRAAIAVAAAALESSRTRKVVTL